MKTCCVKFFNNISLISSWNEIFFFCPMPPPHVLVDFVVLPPGYGRSATDFWGWEAHEAQLRYPYDVSGDIGRCSARRALKPKFYQPTLPWSPRESSPSGKISTVEPGIEPGTSWLVVRDWPLDHEAGRNEKCFRQKLWRKSKQAFCVQ